MTDEAAKIGIFGGTFDPVHNGHLITANEIRDKFRLDKVLFIPSGNPPHKAMRNLSPAEDRYEMVSLAIEGNDHFEVSKAEMQRKGYAFTVDTLMQLKGQYGRDVQLYFIAGADVVWDLLKWKEPEKLMSLCQFIIAMRPGYDKRVLLSKIKKIEEKYPSSIYCSETVLVDISSTAVRERIRDARTIKYLVPESVERYIYNKGLYLDMTED